MSDIGFDNIDWNRLGDPEYLISLGVDPTIANSPPAPAPGPTTVGGIVQNNLSGRAIIQAILRGAGLDVTPELDQYISDLSANYGNDVTRLGAVVNADLYDKQSTLGKIVDQRYPTLGIHNAAAVAQGLPTLSVGDYLSTRQQNEQIIQDSGLSPYVDKQALADKWIAGFTSPSEAADRIKAAQTAVFNEPLEVRAAFHQMFGGGDSLGAATAYFLDPAASVPKIQQQLRAAEIGGAATRVGYGVLTADEASRLAQLGVSADQAQQGFGQLASESQILSPLPGEVDPGISRDVQLAAQFGGDAAAQQQILRARQAKQAVFGDAGRGWATGRAGVGGLGSAAV